MSHLRTLTVVLLLAVAAPAAGQVWLREPPIQPAAPVANEPVSALVESNTFRQTPIAVRRSGFEIELVHQAPGCPITCTIWQATVDLGRLPAGTYTLRVVDVGDPANPWVSDETTFAVSPSPCGGLCLLGGRFTVTAEWTTVTGATGSAEAVPTTTDATGSFWFFNDDNVELVVKVLDACSYNSRHWFFAAGLTDVRVVLRVHDNLTGVARSYENPLGRPFQPITDTQAFGCP